MLFFRPPLSSKYKQNQAVNLQTVAGELHG